MLVLKFLGSKTTQTDACSFELTLCSDRHQDKGPTKAENEESEKEEAAEKEDAAEKEEAQVCCCAALHSV